MERVPTGTSGNPKESIRSIRYTQFREAARTWWNLPTCKSRCKQFRTCTRVCEDPRRRVNERKKKHLCGTVLDSTATLGICGTPQAPATRKLQKHVKQPLGKRIVSMNRPTNVSVRHRGGTGRATGRHQDSNRDSTGNGSPGDTLEANVSPQLAPRTFPRNGISEVTGV